MLRFCQETNGRVGNRSKNKKWINQSHKAVVNLNFPNICNNNSCLNKKQHRCRCIDPQLFTVYQYIVLADIQKSHHCYKAELWVCNKTTRRANSVPICYFHLLAAKCSESNKKLSLKLSEKTYWLSRTWGGQNIRNTSVQHRYKVNIYIFKMNRHRNN